MAASELPSSIEVGVIGGDARPLGEWLMNFQLMVVALDPYTYESSWIIETASRILTNYRGSSMRVGWIVTGTDEAGAKEFLGPFADEFITFLDPEMELVKASEIERLPAFLHIRQDGQLRGAAEGWQPAAWKSVADNAAKDRNWSSPLIPGNGDPAPYEGSLVSI